VKNSIFSSILFLLICLPVNQVKPSENLKQKLIAGFGATVGITYLAKLLSEQEQKKTNALVVSLGSLLAYSSYPRDTVLKLPGLTMVKKYLKIYVKIGWPALFSLACLYSCIDCEMNIRDPYAAHWYKDSYRNERWLRSYLAGVACLTSGALAYYNYFES
jgi:hypothetical protein